MQPFLCMFRLIEITHNNLPSFLPLKGYSRKGTALLYLQRNQAALETFQKGLALDANNQQLKEGLAESKRRVSSPRAYRLIVNWNSCCWM